MKNYYLYIEELTAKTKLLSTALPRPKIACLPRPGHLNPTSSLNQLHVESWLLSNDLSVSRIQQPLIVDLDNFASLSFLLPVK